MKNLTFKENLMTEKKIYLSPPAQAVNKYLIDMTEKEHGVGTKYKSELSALRNSSNRSVENDMELFKKVTKILSDNGYYAYNSSYVTIEEEAVGSAITLFASHYGTKVRFPYNENRSFGQALAEIQYQLEFNQPGNDLIVGKLNLLLKSNSINEYRRHIKSILNFATNEKTSFHYGVFTQDLLDIQKPERKNIVLRKWTRDFYNHLHNLKTGNTQQQPQKPQQKQ